MSNISVLDPSSPSTSTSVSSILNSAKQVDDKSYNEDEVSISEEAEELLAELRYKANQTRVFTENQRMFDTVSKALPATEGFEDMLNWLSGLEDDDTFTIGGMEEINRNVYEKDPEKYADLWGNMYNHFTELMDNLGLSGDATMRREVMSNESVSAELVSRFTSSFSEETNTLLSFFNISVNIKV